MILCFMFQGHSELQVGGPWNLEKVYVLLTINSSLASHLVDNSFHTVSVLYKNQILAQENI